MRKNTWSDELLAEVERLLRQGLNPKEIAPLVNKPRNAICGMIFRNPVLAAAQKERLDRMSHGDRYRHWIKKKEPPVETTPPVTLKPQVYDARALRITLMELSHNQCRYPVSNSTPHVFCGHARWSDTTMYCEHHQRRCVAAKHA